MLTEEITQMMSRLSPLHRKILQLRLQGQSTEETAREARCTERSVHRAMELVRKTLEERLGDGAGL